MPPLNPADATDVRLTLLGERDAFARLYDRHAGAVRAVVCAVSKDFEAVEDLTQETFLRGYKQLSTLRDAGSFRSWIQGVARMVARERLRELSRERRRFESDANQRTLAADTRCGESDAIELDDEQRRVMSTLAELPERERLVVHAYFFHEQSADETATALSISRSGFYATLDRAMARLRKRLGVPTTKKVSRQQRN